MRVILQRVKQASVTINDKIHSEIGVGFLLLVGIEQEDGEEDLDWLAPKIAGLRVFSDAGQKMNLDIQQVNGEILIVSQFTLHASVKKGNRPSFIKAARPETAIPLYEQFIFKMSTLIGKPCKAGVFGADMKVALINDGPVTILLDSKNKE